MRHSLRPRWGLALLGLLGAVSGAAAQTIQFRSQTFFGGTGNELATGVAVVDTGGASAVYLSGQLPNTLGGEGLALRYNLANASFSPSFQWSQTYSGLAGSDRFAGVAANTSSAFFAGDSFARTTDTVGDKEN
jgi:hypothetical protein